MMVFTHRSLDAAIADAHAKADRFQMDIGAWETEGHWSDPAATHKVLVPAERKHGPFVDGAVYVALTGGT